MPTKIGNPLSREMMVDVNYLDEDRPLVATLKAPGLLELRPKQTRAKVSLKLADLYAGEGAVKLTKPVERVTDTVIRDRGTPRLLCVALLPGDVIRLWPQGIKSGGAFEISLASVYAHAGAKEGERQRREKAALKKNSR